jgi:hypothetical protein
MSMEDAHPHFAWSVNMFSLHLRSRLRIVSVAVVTLALIAGNSSATVILNFIEPPNDGGIHLTGTEANGTPIDVTLSGSETFRVAAPACTMIAGCNPNFTTAQIGSQNQTEYLVNILESPGGPLSDQVWVHRLATGGGVQVIDFFSDSGFVTGGPGAVVTTVVETGSVQSVLSYPNDNNGQPVNISVLSAVPEPGTLALLGLAAVGLAFSWRKSR